MALTNKLTAIGDAIRAKTGKTDLLTLDQMPTEIAAIETGTGETTTEKYNLNRYFITPDETLSYIDLTEYLSSKEDLVAMFWTLGYKVSGYSGESYYPICSYLPNENGDVFFSFIDFISTTSEHYFDASCPMNLLQKYKLAWREDDGKIRVYLADGTGGMSSNFNKLGRKMIVITKEVI